MSLLHPIALSTTLGYSGFVLTATNQFSQDLDHQTTPNCASLLTSRGQRRSRRSKSTGLCWEESFWQRGPVPWGGDNTVTTLVKNKKAQLVVISHDVDPIKLLALPACPVLQEFWLRHQGEGQAGVAGSTGRKTDTSVALTQGSGEAGGSFQNQLQQTGRAPSPLARQRPGS